jgi:hypothetical protein
MLGCVREKRGRLGNLSKVYSCEGPPATMVERTTGMRGRSHSSTGTTSR